MMSSEGLFEYNDDGDYLLKIQKCRQHDEDSAYADNVEVSIDGRTCCLPPSQRQAAAQALAGDGYRVVPAKAATVDPDSLDLMHEDLRRILDVLGLSDHARPYSPHECVTRDVLPAIERLKQAASIPDWERELLAGQAAQEKIDQLRRERDDLRQEMRDLACNHEPDRPEPVDPESGAGLIAAERARQINDEGRTAEHDDGHPLGELLDAAATYLMRDLDYWPWEGPPKFTSDDRVRELVKAGALIAAEIDRMQRAATSAPDPKQIEAWHNWFGRLIMRMTDEGINETAIKQASIELAAAGLEVPE